VNKVFRQRINNIKPLTEEEEEIAWNDITTHKKRIMESYLKLAIKYAYDMKRKWKELDIDDLIQEASLGLAFAVDRFDPSRGYKFSTFATTTIVGHLMNYIRDEYVNQVDTVPIDYCINELPMVEPVEDEYLRSEARLNLRRKIEQFRSTLSYDEMIVWDERIFSKNKTLVECQEFLGLGSHMAVKRIEDTVRQKAKDYFQSLDYLDLEI
jgi:RNA polymerase sigma factor (sigma-70 family)